ncbi:hypothetical protein LI90_4378 (plasmid) [Carbonactinospora thermoautotrophica]|uniref:Major capsid protein n=1 Tax=Carbonactinospora thermoautotrophica TaxID=1469144 RepID=A0A132MHT8_9ACTN|nr:major capsid protein [Carbonactinospora thermoautotrophica]KWW97406.1 hypothetical protein LI90_4378 [Carbonactinospora thermoautotrophica]
MPGTTYPPAPPTISGSNITVDVFLRNPTRVQRTVAELLQNRFIVDFIFSQGGADGGAVVYDQITSEADLFTTRDVQEIAPGDEFPVVDDGEVTPKVAAVGKYGGMVKVTHEAVRRDQRDVLGQKLRKLRNTVVRKVDTLAVAALDAAPIRTMGAAKPWSDPTADPFADILTAVDSINSPDLGYEADTVLINPAQVLALLKRKDVRDALPRESRELNPILSGQLAGLCGIPNWIPTNRVPAGTMYVLQRQMAGSVRDEVPLYARSINDERREVWWIQAARVTVPVVTDPLCVNKVTGL